MKVSLSEIWGFMDLAPVPDGKDKNVKWLYELVAGDIKISGLTDEDILALKQDGNYDTELLPTIFTYREVLWQPNVYTQPSLCLPQLNILKVFCEEYNAELANGTTGVKKLYHTLLEGLGKYCGEAHKKITSAANAGDVRIPSILGDLRKNAFPIIKFFLFHPMNRPDYQKDALNRLNYAVKIMLTQYNNKYDDLKDPFWLISKGKPVVEEAPLENQKVQKQVSEQKVKRQIPTLPETQDAEIEELGAPVVRQNKPKSSE